MSGLSALREALPTWVRIERRPGAPVVSSTTVGTVHVIEMLDYPEAPTGATRADLHFVLIAPTEGLPDPADLVATVRAALGEGVHVDLAAEDLSAGPSYIALGAWLGSQDLALMLIGAVELAGISPAITPGILGVSGEAADAMAGSGFVMLGPSQCWMTGDLP